MVSRARASVWASWGRAQAPRQSASSASNGPPGIPPGSTDPQKIRLIKDGPRTQLLADGRVIIDLTDDPKRYGPMHTDGKIGLRQMQWMVARYRNFRA